MTEAQRQAYEYFSGEITIDCVDADGNPHLFGCRLAGAKVFPQDLDRIGKAGCKIPKYVIENKKKRNQIRGRNIPKEMIVDETYDTWKNVVRVNKKRAKDFFDDAVLNAKKAGITPTSMGLETFDGFCASMAFHHLIELEENIIRDEHHKMMKGKFDDLSTHDEDLKEHEEVWNTLKEQFGEKFAIFYNEAFQTHNECERHNLDSSNGHLYCYVLPKFNPDGSHDPWGERDVPWAAYG